MAKKSKTSKVLTKVLSVILCVAILGTTYSGFFRGMDAAAGAVDQLSAGEVGLTKDVVQNGRGADIIVQTAAMPVEITSTNIEVIEQVLDVVLIIDTSGSMGTSYGNLIKSAKTAAKDLASTIYSMNPQNRIALGSFAQYAYAYNKSSNTGVEYSKIDVNAGTNTYFFGSGEQATLNKRIDSLSAVGGTNSEGGLLVAEKLMKVSDQSRKKLIIFFTDGLPTGRYKDNGSKVNTVATYDGSGNGIPNYEELSEMVSVAERISADGNSQMATIFYTGGLETNDSMTQYYKGCTSSNCRCNEANSNHGATALKAPGSAGMSAEQTYMSPFYKKTSLKCAEHIVNDLLAPSCEAGVYMPENASQMLEAFQDIVTNYVTSNLYKAASNAYYEDIVPDYAAVVPASMQVSSGKVELLENQWVELNGRNVQRDVVRWTIGDIPSEPQTLTYSIAVKDERDYGIMDASVQGILRYDTCQYTQTQPPLIAQIDEIILAPKGGDDYYVVEQEKSLEANVKINDDILNHLIDTTGNNQDATTLVNGYPAGIEGNIGAAHLAGYTTEIVSQPAWGSVILNDDGTFTYVQNSDLYATEVGTLEADSNGTDEYNAITSGWEDTFTYKLVTDGWANKYTKHSTTTTTTTTTTTGMNFDNVNSIAGDKLCLLVFDNMNQTGADSEGRVIIGGDLTVNSGWAVSNTTNFGNDYALIVGGKYSGGANVVGGASAIGEEWIAKYADEAEKAFGLVSKKYAELPADGDGSRNQWYRPSVTLKASPSHRAGTPHVFYIDGNETIGEIKFSGNFGTDQIIINISGTNLSYSGGQWGMFENCDLNATTLAQQTTWNFYEATALNTSSLSFFGSLLAPKATYTASNGHVNGTTIVKNMIGTGGFEYHANNFYYDATGIGEQVTTTTTTHTETSVTSERIPLSDYEVSANQAVTDAAQAIESKEITVHIRVKPDLSDLTARKESVPESGALVKNGDEITYTVRVFNPRTIPAENVVITDAVPAGTTFVSADNGGMLDASGKVVWTASIAPKQSVAVSFTVKVNDSVIGKNNLANVAYAAYTTPGVEGTTTINTNTVTHAILSAEKTSDIPEGTVLDQGAQITYTIDVTNGGSADATDVTVEDTVPAGTTFVSGEGFTADESGKLVATIPVLAAGESQSVSFTVQVSDFATGTVTITNTAKVNGDNTNTTVNTAKRGSVIVYHKDKANGNDLLEPTTASGKTGDAYGPFTKENIANYRYVDVNGSPSGTFSGDTAEVIFYYDRIPGNATVYYRSTEGEQLAEPKSFSGWQGDTLADNAKVDSIGNWVYESTDDSQGYVFTESGIVIVHYYKLKVDQTLPTVLKTAAPASGSLVRSGDQITYTISVTNNKYEDMHNVVISDNAPKGTTIVAVDGAPFSGAAATWTVPVIAAGATASVNFTVQVNGSFDGAQNLSNTANVQYVEREAANATSIDTNTTTHAVLVADKYTSTIKNGFVGVGDTYTYFIRVQNVGTAAANGIVIRDDVPAGTTLAAGSTNSWTIDLAPGAEKTVSFDVVVQNIEGFNANVINTAYVNDVPTNTTSTPVQKGTVDVHFVDEAGNKLADSLHYEGTPGREHGSVAAIIIPAYTYFTTEGETAGAFVNGNITITHIYKRTPAVATIMYVDKDTSGELLPRVTENAFVGDTLADEHYSDIENYEFLETTREDGLVFTEDGITIIHYYRFIKPDDTLPTFTKSSDPASGTVVREGSTITYTLTFKNTRIDPIYNLTITDRIPEGATLASEDIAADENGVLAWTVPELASGATAEVSFTVSVNSDLTGSGNLRNVAKATYENRDNEPEEPIYSNEVSHPVIKAKLDHYNNQPELILTQGDEITYVITTVNTGSATAYDVPVESYIPEGTVFARTEDGVVEGGVFRTVIPELIPGTPVQHTFTVTIGEFAENEFERAIPNIAKVNEVNTNTVDDEAKIGDLRVNHIDFDGKVIETSFNRERVGTTYGPLTDLVSEKKIENRKFISVDNNTTGKYTAQLTTVNFYYDRIPAVLVVKYIDKDTETEIKAADSYVGTYFLGDAIPESYTDEVAVDGYIYHKELLVKPEPMSFDETTEVIVHYYERILDTDRPEVEKTASPASGSLVVAGQEITYSVRVKNVRATDALENVVVTDAIPAGMTLLANSINEGGSENEGVITWNIGSIAAGEEKVLTFRARVNDGLDSGINLANTAKVAYRDVQVGENVTIDTNPTSHALLVAGKQSSVPAETVLTDGSLIKYTVTVKNVGSAAANNVVITDSVPAGTALIAESLPEGATVENGVITYTIDELAAGASESLTFQVKVSMHDSYSLEIKNTARVNGQDTNEVTNIAQRGTVTIKYIKVDETGAETELTEFAGRLEGEVGTAILLPEMKTFDKWQHLNTTITNESKTFIAGNIEIVYYFGRIPARATVYYRDIDVPAATIAPTKRFNAYVGDILPDTYQEAIQYYNFVRTDAPASLEYTENGLVITHWYDEIIDKTDLVRTKTAVPAPGTVVLPGSDITYTITVKNPRREALSNITVTDPIPAGCTVKAADGATVADGKVVWTGITLDVNEEKSFSFTVKVNETFTQGGNLRNKASVTFINRKDTEPTTLYTETVNHAVLVTGKTVDKEKTNVGGEITYTISAANYGSVAAQNVVITDTIPEGTTLKTGSAVGATVKDGVITWKVGKLDAGKSVEVRFTAIASPIENNIYNTVVSNTAKVNEIPTNTVSTVVTQGTVTVTHVTDTGAVLIPTVVTTYDVGDSYEYEKEDIYGYDYVTVEGQPKGKVIEGNIDVTFIYKKGEGNLTVCYLEEGTNHALADTVTEIMNIGDVITDLHEKSISGYSFVRTDKPEELIMTREGVEIIHYYTYNPDKYKVAGAVWVTEESDSTFSEGDTGYENLEVKLVDTEGNIVQTTTSDIEGKFEFTEVPTGNYTVEFELPEKFKLAGAVEYANEQLNSVVDEAGTFAISVIENTDNIGMELFHSEVLGASEEVINTFKENTIAYRNEVQTVQPIQPVVTKAENVTYGTVVLGDADGSPRTGDNDMATVTAVMIASCALFVLILCRKGK